MTLTEPRGIEFVRRLGVERVILARELSVEDIGRIAGRRTCRWRCSSTGRCAWPTAANA